MVSRHSKKACLIYSLVIVFILSLICACKDLCSSRFLAENDEVEDDEEELSDVPEEDEPPSYESVVTDGLDEGEVDYHKPEETESSSA